MTRDRLGLHVARDLLQEIANYLRSAGPQHDVLADKCEKFLADTDYVKESEV